MAYKPRWVESEETFVGSTDNMLYVGANGKLQETSKMRFDADSGNGRIYIGELGDAVQRLDIVADTAFSYSVTDVVTYVNSVSMDGASLTIQIADSPGNISQSNIELTRTGKATFSSQNDAGDQMIFTVDSGVSDTAFTFEAGSGNTEVRIDDSGITLATGPAINEISNDSASDSTSVLLTSSAIQSAISGFSGGLFTEDANDNIIGGTGAGGSGGTDNFIAGVNAAGSKTGGSQNIIIGNNAGESFPGSSTMVVIGYEALNTMASGDDAGGHVVIGWQAAYSMNESGNAGSVFIGYQAGYYLNETLGHNVIVGQSAGYGGPSGTIDYRNCVALGREAGYANKTGDDNVSIGYQAGRGPFDSTNDGEKNTFVGSGSGYNIDTGDNNVGFGYQSLYSLVSGSGNVAIGYEAGYSETGSNKLHIANNQTESLIEGDFSARTVTINGSLTVTDATSITLASTVLSEIDGGGLNIGGSLQLQNSSSINTISNDYSSNDTSTLMTSSAIRSLATTPINISSTSQFNSFEGLKNYNRIESRDIEQEQGPTSILSLSSSLQSGNIVPFDNGNILYIEQPTATQTVYAIVDKNLNVLKDDTTISSNFCEGANGVLLNDGYHAGVIYFESSTNRRVQYIKVDSTGEIVIGPITVVQNTTSQPYAPYIKALPNNTLLILFKDGDVSSTIAPLAFVIIDVDGNILKSRTQITSNSEGAGYTDVNYNATVLPNGNVVIVWREFTGSFTGNGYGVMYDQFGNELVSKTLLTSDLAQSNDNIFKVIYLNNGNWAFFYRKTGSADILRLKIYDQGFSEVVGETAIQDNSTGNFAPFGLGIASLPDNKIFIQGGSTASPYSWRHIIDQDGNILQTDEGMYGTGDSQDAGGFINAICGKNGKVVVSTNFIDTIAGRLETYYGNGTKVDGDLEVTGSITASTLTVDASSVIIGATELTEKSGGGLLVNGQEVGGGGGVTDHGALTGLADDDHTQYFRTDGTRVMTGPIQFQNGGSADEVSTDSASDSTSVLLTSSAVQEAISSNLVFTEDSDNNIIGGTGAGSSIVGGSGTNNFLAGSNAGFGITTGDRNIIIGNSSGDGLDTGSSNIGIGHQALTGFGGNPSNCIAIGYQAMGSISSSPSSCIAIGFQALQEVGSGGGSTSNVGIGTGAGSNVTTGDNNIIIGDTAGSSITTASGCVIIGYQAGLNETSSNKLHIANNQTESLIEGDFSARTAHVNGTFTAEKVEAFSGSVISTDSTAITNQVVLVNASGGAVTVDLIYEENAYIVVKKTDSSVNAVTIQGADGKTIDGSATQSLTTQYQAYTLFGFNGAWHII